MSVEMLKAQIRMLMGQLARNGFEMRREKRVNRTIDLMAARMEIYKSIAHRQGMIIEIQAAHLKFSDKEAA